MSFIPPFELGVWNAWVLIIPLIVFWFGGIKFIFSKRMPDSPPIKRRKDKIFMQMLMVAMLVSFFYSIFLPLRLGTIWFFIGLVVYLLSIILISISMINFASTPLGIPVTKGIYRFSRNPMFIGFFLVYFGIAISCVSWLYLLITVLFISIVVYLSPIEETVTLGHYGKSYKEYMIRTPKWIGIPKSKQ